jgi:hypothetical protein
MNTLFYTVYLARIKKNTFNKNIIHENKIHEDIDKRFFLFSFLFPSDTFLEFTVNESSPKKKIDIYHIYTIYSSSTVVVFVDIDSSMILINAIGLRQQGHSGCILPQLRCIHVQIQSSWNI